MLVAMRVIQAAPKATRATPTTTKVLRDVHPPSGSDRFMHCGSDQQLAKSCRPYAFPRPDPHINQEGRFSQEHLQRVIRNGRGGVAGRLFLDWILNGECQLESKI